MHGPSRDSPGYPFRTSLTLFLNRELLDPLPLPMPWRVVACCEEQTSHKILEKLAPSSEPVGHMEVVHAESEDEGLESWRGSVGDSIGLPYEEHVPP